MNKKILGVTDQHGLFMLKGVCMDTPSNITIKMDGFSSVTLQSMRKEPKVSYFEAALNKLGKSVANLYIY